MTQKEEQLHKALKELEKCTGGTFTGMLKLHFKSDVDNEYDSTVCRISNGSYAVKKYENGEFYISINNIICDYITVP